MFTLKVFLSFRHEDFPACDDFCSQYSDDTEIQFVVFPPIEDDGDWKSPVRELIRMADGLVVLVGRNTARSDAVSWEIGVAAELGKNILGVRIPGGRHPQPGMLLQWPLLDWDPGQI